jgi:hypothetical protein
LPAITLPVLNLRAPAMEAIHNEHDLWQALTTLSPRLVMYTMSFMTLGILWVGQQTQLNHLERSNWIERSAQAGGADDSEPQDYIDFQAAASTRAMW